MFKSSLVQCYHTTIIAMRVNKLTKKFLSKQKISLFKGFIKTGDFRLAVVGIKVLLVSIFLSILTFVINSLVFWNKIHPGISIAGVLVGSQNSEESLQSLSTQIKIPEKIVLEANGQSFEILTETLNLSYDYEASINRAYHVFRSGNWIHDLSNQYLALIRSKNLGLITNIDEESLNESLSVIAGQVTIDPINPSVKISSGEIMIDSGSPGTDIDLKILKARVEQALSFTNQPEISIDLIRVDPSLSGEQLVMLKNRVDNYLGKTITLVFEDNVFSYKENELLSLINPLDGFDKEKISLLISEVAKSVNRFPQNAVFEFREGKVHEFLPAESGIQITEKELSKKIIRALIKIESSNIESVSIGIPFAETKPKITTGEANNLGIKELVGKGTSRFSGSISSRIHNIGLASFKFSGALVAPGETFSFNDVLGDVSIFTGYKQAYIIKDGKTVLGDGGGVCQVSTTLFRAILDAGLPIVERAAHSYRVSYYEQGSPPGLDATVYAPTTDLKFKNDTPGHLLIQTKFHSPTSSLAFEIYGTSDSRESTISKPVVTSILPPPEDLYVDDPTLPEGTTKQIDWKAWGARVHFDYSVERNENVIYQKTFYSNYRPWQAVFLRGTGPAI